MVARRPVHDVQCHDVRWLLTALCGSVAARHVRKMFRANTRVRVPVVRGVKAGQRSCFVRAVFFHRKNESPTGTLVTAPGKMRSLLWKVKDTLLHAMALPNGLARSIVLIALRGVQCGGERPVPPCAAAVVDVQCSLAE